MITYEGKLKNALHYPSILRKIHQLCRMGAAGTISVAIVENEPGRLGFCCFIWSAAGRNTALGFKRPIQRQPCLSE